LVPASSGPNDLAILAETLPAERLAEFDLFDQAQLASVIRACRAARSLSEAGRALFSVSRLSKAQPNDADRLRKYLARFGLAWSDLTVG
jgi:transcriptional regulatory protein RtcR